jgi:hypothetical protein
MEELEALIETLEKSVEKNGEKPLTNAWLLNILKVTIREMEMKDLKRSDSDFGSDLF